MRIIRVAGSQLVTTVIVFSWIPLFPSLLNTTFILALWPGLIGSFGHSGTVQPQLPLAPVIIKLLEPIFLKLKAWFTFSPCVIFPKSNSSSSNLISGKSLLDLPSAVAELETSSESIVFLSLPSSHDIKTITYGMNDADADSYSPGQ